MRKLCTLILFAFQRLKRDWNWKMMVTNICYDPFVALCENRAHNETDATRCGYYITRNDSQSRLFLSAAFFFVLFYFSFSLDILPSFCGAYTTAILRRMLHSRTHAYTKAHCSDSAIFSSFIRSFSLLHAMCAPLLSSPLSLQNACTKVC